MAKYIFFLLIFATFVQAQDPYITIGKLKLRYDQDTNALKIGYTGTYTGLTNFRLMKELNTQLFPFNANQFLWDNVTGLNLNTYNVDSLVAKKWVLLKDTSFGETQWYKYWRLMRKYYNMQDSLTLKWYYSNTQFSSSDEFFAINKIYVLSEKALDVELNDGFQTIETLTFPHEGMWKVTALLDYEFEFDVNQASDVKDSIYVKFRHSPNIDIGYSLISIACPTNVFCGQKGQLQLVSNYYQSSGESYTFYVHALCSNNAMGTLVPLKRKLKYLKVFAELIY